MRKWRWLLMAGLILCIAIYAIELVTKCGNNYYRYYQLKSTGQAPLSEFMLLKELEELLAKDSVTAYFETVSKDYRLEKYTVKIEGIYEIPGLKVIMFTTGYRIAAGMSGSPVYVNGRKIGALAYSFNSFSDINWGGISPIELMLKENNEFLSGRLGTRESGNQEARPGFYYRQMFFQPLALGNQSISADFLEKNGLDPFLVEALKNQKVIISTQQAAEAELALSFSPLIAAGMPIVVDLVEWQDEEGKVTTISALGTITHVDVKSGRLYAFGHPFLQARKVKYSFRSCRILGTVPSSYYSFKLDGKKSGALGVIDYDADYGIYGKISAVEVERLPVFNLEFKRQGNSFHRFRVRLAENKALAVILMGTVLDMIGECYQAPLPSETSVTEFASQVELAGFSALTYRYLATSLRTTFGGNDVYTSSYQAAARNFIWNVYIPLMVSRYGFKITDLKLTANFLPGKPQKLTLVACRFPTKVVWGANPVLDVMLASENNTIALEKRMVIPVNWKMVEEPLYSKDVREIEKEEGKIVRGVFRIFGQFQYVPALLESEKQKLLPEYFLSAEDFLDFFSRQLQTSDQKIYGKIILQAKSGLFEKAQATAGNLLSPQAREDKSGQWHILDGGLKKRQYTIKDEGLVAFYVDFPFLPSGYIISLDLNKNFYFEVVKGQ